MIDFFNSDMFKQASLTDAVQRLPNRFNRIGALGLFPARGVRHRTVGVEELNEVARVLPTLPWGAPGMVGAPGKRGAYAFPIPHIPYMDAVLPEDVQSVREFGSEDQLAQAAAVVAGKLGRMRAQIDITLEYMRATALAGTCRDGAGVDLQNYYTVFGITRFNADFTLGTAAADIRGRCLSIKRDIEKKGRGAVIQGIGCLCSPLFFDRLTAHANVEKAFLQYQTTQPVSGDYRAGFNFAGITFYEYDATVTLADGTTTAEMITAGEALFYPIGTPVGVTVFAPANYMETVNELGLEYYAKSDPRKFGKGVDLEVQSNPLPILLRPDLIARGHSSN